MTISGYRFGRIDIDGRAYTSDVIITPERVDDRWWRREGHTLGIDDVAGVLAARPDVVIIGTGYFGRMSVPVETRQYLQAQGAEVHEAHTRAAVQEFNRLLKQPGRVVAALHLTC